MPKPASSANPLLQEARQFRAKKRFAQNFLVDEDTLNRIAAALCLSAGETVIEIGPGLGFLTERLLQSDAQVIGVELERAMVAHLKQKLGDRPNHQLIVGDILKTDLMALSATRFKIAGNLPYNITSPILFYLAGELHDTDHPLRNRIEQATLMVQKEVGERICAQPGSKAYNPLSISLQYWFDTRYEFSVPAPAFYPQPKVDSAVVTLIPRGAPRVPVRDLTVLSRLIKTAFNQRRKTLKNALAQFAEPAVLDRMFMQVADQYGPVQGLRAEALSIEALGALSDAYLEHTGKS